MAEEHKDIDPVTGIATTGHEWDGLRELNTPLPRWWLWLFYLTIVWSIGYWIVYPAWPLLTTSTQGVFGYHTRSAVADDLEALKLQRGPMVEKLAAASLSSIVADPQLLDFARAQGRVAFADNCAPCHGAGGGGAKGYPNLNDDDWLWGGKLADIEQTIRFGARAGDDKGRAGTMPAFGRDNILKPNEILAVADYTRSLSGLAAEPGTDLDFSHVAQDLKVQATLGIPYTPEMVAKAAADVVAQATNDNPDAVELIKRYPKANARDFDGNPTHITEADALIAYLQMLGTQVDFKLYDDKANIR